MLTLVAGVEHEESAGKWRAGDSAKSLRFFGRAVETYDQGLHLFPESLDLAYNKARVQFEIVTHPRLLQKLEVPLLNGLEEALKSHRYALSLDPDNADTLFNTAQVLTSIAEKWSKVNDDATADVLRLLEEALELQSRCLSIQEMTFEENETQRREMLAHPIEPESEVSTTKPPSGQEEKPNIDGAEDQWFSVVEPVTADTLLDTALAQLASLTTLCSILSSASSTTPSPSLSWIESFSSTLMSTKVSTYTRNAESDRLQEIALAKANFLSSFLEASFHQGSIDSQTYKQERDNAFKAPELLLEQYLHGLVANAQSLMAFSSALSDDVNPPADFHGSTRWHSLSAAITNLATASKLKDIDSENLVQTHLLRGESSLLLWMLSQPPAAFKTAVENQAQLLKNAEVFFRNASKLSQDMEEREVAALRSSIAHILQLSVPIEVSVLLPKVGKEKDHNWVVAQVIDMIDEGLLPSSFREITSLWP